MITSKLCLLILIACFLAVEPISAGHVIVHPDIESFTYIQLNAIDVETNNFIGSPVSVRVIGTYEGGLIENYTITLVSPNDNITAFWNPDFRYIGTAYSLTASKEGYLDSEPYTFVVTEDTPTNGLLFQHTFTMLRVEAQIPVNNFRESIIIGNTIFDFDINTSSDLNNLEFDEITESLVINIQEINSIGFLNIVIPSSFMKAPFVIFIDDIPKSNFEISTQSESYTLDIKYEPGLHLIRIFGNDVFKPDVPLPSLFIEISDSQFNLEESLMIQGSIDPIQPSSDVVIELINPSDEIIIRIVPLLGDGTFEFIFNPDETGEWKAIAKYNFNEEIIESNIIGFSVISISEPRVSPEVPEPEEPEPEEPEPEEPEPKPEEPEEPIQQEKQIEAEEDQDLPDESDETRQVFDNYLFIVLILILAVIIFAAITKQDKLKPYFQKNRTPDKKP